jgi:hypothetical protein
MLMHLMCPVHLTEQVDLPRFCAGPMPAPLVVVEGDIVTFHMTCRDADGNVRHVEQC